MSEDQHRARASSSPDSSDEIEVTTDEPVQSPAAARRARRAKAKLALRIPDDEISRPLKMPDKPPDTQPEPSPAASTNGEAEAIKPSRIISVGPPPAADVTPPNIPPAPPTPAEMLPHVDDEAQTPMLPGVVAKSGSKTELDSDETDIEVPVDEDEPEYRPKMPTIPSTPPPAPDALAKISQPPPPKPTSQPPAGPAATEHKKLPSSEELEIDEVEAAAVLSRPPPAPVRSSIPAPPRAPPSSLATPPPTPIPVDAMSSTPQLEQPKARAAATALLDEEEARGIEEIEPDRSSAPPSIDSGDEISTSDVVLVATPAVAGAARAPSPEPPARVSTPPKPAPPLPQKMIPLVAAAGGLAVPSPLAPPPLTEGLVPRRRARPWWEELFNDDFVRTMPKFTEAQVADEVDFIEDSLGVAKGGAMLDLGCGTGSHAIELTRRGYAVVGFDLSLALLARAGEQAQEQNQKINFVQGDMREMTFDEAFDGVYCWGSTFGFFEEEKNVHVVTRVHNALRHGGQFLLDVVSRDFIIKQAPSLAWFEGEGCVCMDEMAVDWITSRMRIKRTMMLDDGRSKEIEYSIRVYSLHELGKLLHECGFRVAEVSGRIQTPGVFFGPDSPRTLILAEKR